MVKTMKRLEMKKVFVVLLFMMLSAGVVFAKGGKNQGSTGKGTTSIGEDASGVATQSRTGR